MISRDGITEEKIRQMVTQFYAKVRADDVLGPVFNTEISDPEWPHHLDRMCDFWSSVLLASGRYHGSPPAVHAALPNIQPNHFDRWLTLFEPVLHQVYDAETASQIFMRAQRMRAVLQNFACQS